MFKCCPGTTTTLQVSKYDLSTQRNENLRVSSHNLSVDGKKERPIFHSIEVESIIPVCKTERAEEGTLIGIEGS